MVEINTIIQGDCLESIKQLDDNSVDAVVTDPPYGLNFMGKKWDYDIPATEVWQECLRVLKPGGYLLSFAGTRTQHRMACRIEDAGFEIRDMIAWVYGSGFPKSLNVGRAVDKLRGVERESETVKGKVFTGSNNNIDGESGEYTVDKGASEWEGWGTALKPAFECITIARKPIGEKTVAENCLRWGVGGINIDGSRVGCREKEQFTGGEIGTINTYGDYFYEKSDTPLPSGRFPANFIHDGSEEVIDLFPHSKSSDAIRHNHQSENTGAENGASCYGKYNDVDTTGYSDSGSSARFFYCAKASKSERNKGCEGLPVGEAPGSKRSAPAEGRSGALGKPRANHHPTVKPIALMEYLIKLVSREGALILDPFAGSGSTLIACKNTGRNYIGCELDPEYIDIANCRINGSSAQLRLEI